MQPRARRSTRYAQAVALGPDRVVVEVVGFEALPLGASASRRAFVRWSDGEQSEAARWYDDEFLICEGDLIGKTTEEIRSLLFRRDRDWLQS